MTFGTMVLSSKMNFIDKLVVLTVVVFGASPVNTWTFWQPPPTSASCTNVIPFADRQDCHSYYQCFRVNALWTLIHSTCPTGGYWDDLYKACVEGSCGGQTTVPTSKPSTKRPVTPKPSVKPPVGITTKKPVTKQPSTSTTRRVTKPPSTPPPSGNPCPYAGYFADPTDCKFYYKCALVRGRMYRYSFMCPFTSYWNGNRCVVGKCKNKG